MEHESDVYTCSNECNWNNPQKIRKMTGGNGNKRTSGDHPD